MAEERGLHRLCENSLPVFLIKFRGGQSDSPTLSYLRGDDRSQSQLLPACLDDFVAPDAPARFLDAYVEGLDFA